MMTLAEVFASPLCTFGIGLALGLWVAVNVWIWRWAAGYKAGVNSCMKEIEPVRVEIATLAGLHHVSEDMRQRIQAAQESAGEETRH
jgi:hypothetical protein